MALADSRPQRVTMLCGMYFAQGVPWGFMVTALTAYLAARGISAAEVGELTAIVLVPWTFKIIWAPLIDTMTIRSMGRRRPWIIGAELMMAASLLGLLSMGDLTNHLGMLKWMFFLHNCFASLQDVATDALAIDILPPDEQGKTNGMMWGSKLIGKAVGAAGMANVIYAWGLPAAIQLQFILLVLISLLPMLMVERAGEKRFPWSPGQASAAGSGSTSSLRSPVEVIRDVLHAFAMTTTVVFFVFGTIKLIGWGIVEVITKTLYTQELGWTFVEVSDISGWSVFPEMLGAIAGGYIADRYGRRKVMIMGFGCYGLMAMVFAASPELWGERWFTGAYLFLNPGVLAMGAVGFLSMGMKLSWSRAAATMFTIYMTVSNIGHVVGNWLVGPLQTELGLSYVQLFWTAGFCLVVPLLLLPLVRPEQVENARIAYDRQPAADMTSAHP